MVLALNQLVWPHGHVVPQIVKSKFIVGPVNHIALVGLATGFGVGLVLVNAIHREAVELKNGTHPFRVPSRQIIIDRDQMHTSSGQCIQEHRKGGHQGLSLTRLHFGHLASVQCNTPNQLHIVVDHVPFHI